MFNFSHLNLLEKLQLIFLGLGLSLLIVGVTLFYLITDTAAFFPVFFELIWFYDFQAYWVSCLWLGVATSFFGRYFVALVSNSDGYMFGVVGLLMTMIGLCSAFWVAFLS